MTGVTKPTIKSGNYLLADAFSRNLTASPTVTIVSA